MNKKVYISLAMTALLVLCSVVTAAPLPLTSIEGSTGILITSTAYMANPAEEGEFWGKPSVSATAIFGKNKDLQSYGITENILGKFEIGYAYERFGLGNWPSDVKKHAGAKVDKQLGMHNLNLRAMLVEEGKDASWMPAVTFGTHFKWNESTAKLNRDTGGLLDNLGSDRNWGTEFTLVASKTVTDLLPRPVILTAGLRNGDAIHTGLFGFAGERATTFEGHAVFFLTDRLAFSAEYRQKSNLMDGFSAGGKELVKAENDWWTLCLTYVVDDSITMSAGYANLGNLGNSQEDNVWGIKMKYEF
jgi:hypothetical protein